MKKIVYLLRSVPGAGKSSLAKELATRGTSVICCADDYFTDNNGNYNWYVEGLSNAHKYCQNLFEKHLLLGTDTIIVANTSTRESDVNFYRNLAIKHDYQVFVMIVENYHNGNDIHNVPKESKENMKKQLLNSIKL